MVGARHFAIVRACRVGSKPAWGRFSDKYITFPPSQRWNIVSMFVSSGKVLNPHMLHLIQLVFKLWGRITYLGRKSSPLF